MLEKNKNGDRKKLITSVKKSTTVSYIHGGNYFHLKVLPRTFTSSQIHKKNSISNILFPQKSSNLIFPQKTLFSEFVFPAKKSFPFLSGFQDKDKQTQNDNEVHNNQKTARNKDKITQTDFCDLSKTSSKTIDRVQREVEGHKLLQLAPCFSEGVYIHNDKNNSTYSNNNNYNNNIDTVTKIDLEHNNTPTDHTSIDTSSFNSAPHLQERLRINVSGQCFESQLELFEKHPETLLGNREKRKQYFDQSKNELFFDRHRPSFEAIFSYYQYGGRLKRPLDVPDEIFLSEILFYQIEQETVDEYKKGEGYELGEAPLPADVTMRKIWMLFENPETSTLAFAIAIFSVAVTLVSIVLFCVETLPVFATSHCEKDEAPNFLDPFFIIETFCTVWFTFEVLVRFLVSPNKILFWKDFKNIIDVTAILPYYITLFNVLSTMSCEGAKSSASLAFLRVIRLVRVFKLTKHSVGLQVLVLTFKASLEGLGLFLVALFVCLLVFSSAIYYAELGTTGSQIKSIPDAFWWAIITMTTVGYGDKCV